MRVVFTTAARSDLTQIGDYIAQDNPDRALSFMRDLRAAALRLGEMPNAFPLVRRYEHHGIRCRAVGSYLIFYRVQDDQVVILHIIHGARDYATLLFAEP
jgi:toxin ParE1/3/4